MAHECIQDGRIDRDEKLLTKHIDESGPVREKLTKVEALAISLDERVHDHRYNTLTGWEPRIQGMESAIAETNRNLAELKSLINAMKAWMDEVTAEKKWWEDKLIGVALQVFTVLLLVWLGIKK